MGAQSAPIAAIADIARDRRDQKAGVANSMAEISVMKDVIRVPEARYAYYRRCQEFRRNGEQCKAPAEKDAQICHAH